MSTITYLGMDEQGTSIPFYNTDFDRAKKYLRLNILNRNKNGSFEKEADKFTSALGYKWPSRLGDMLKDYIAQSRINKLEFNQQNFISWKDYFLNRGFSLWEITELYRAWNEEQKAGVIPLSIIRPWTYTPSKDSIYYIVAKYGIVAIGVYALASAFGRGLGSR